MSLIPEIEIGKKYLWRVEAQENTCPKCGHAHGAKSAGAERVVTVISTIENSVGAHCGDCGAELGTNFPGYYMCYEDGVLPFWGVPYTQLEEIEEEGL